MLAAKPRDAQARFLKGLILTEQGNNVEATATFARLTQDFPELPEPYNNLAALYAQQSKFDLARDADGSRDGAPLIAPADESIEGGGVPGDLNAFTYRADRDGLRCPLGAHVRRSNPRNADLPPGEPGIVSWAKRTLGLDARIGSVTDLLAFLMQDCCGGRPEICAPSNVTLPVARS